MRTQTERFSQLHQSVSTQQALTSISDGNKYPLNATDCEIISRLSTSSSDSSDTNDIEAFLNEEEIDQIIDGFSKNSNSRAVRGANTHIKDIKENVSAENEMNGLFVDYMLNNTKSPTSELFMSSPKRNITTSSHSSSTISSNSPSTFHNNNAAHKAYFPYPSVDNSILNKSVSLLPNISTVKSVNMSYSVSYDGTSPSYSYTCSPSPALLNNTSNNMFGFNHYNYDKKPVPVPVPVPVPAVAAVSTIEINKFSSMSLKDILNEKPTTTELIKFHLIPQLINCELGSKFLQNTFDKSSVKDMRLITEYCMSKHLETMKCNTGRNNNNNCIAFDFVKSSENIFGNFVIQKFFVENNDKYFEKLCNLFLYNNMLRLSKSINGCRVIQKIIKILSKTGNQDLLCKLVQCLKQQISKSSNKLELHNLIIHQNSNHVIQTIINRNIPFNNIQFIQIELEKDLSFYCQHKVGCRIVQCFVRIYGDKLNILKLFHNHNHIHLSQHPFGNYVIQCVIELGAWHSNLSLINEFRNQLISDVFDANNIYYLSKSQFGSNVAEQCIKVSNNHQRNLLIKHIYNNCIIIPNMIRHKYGNYVIKTLLNQSDDKQKILLLKLIQKYVPDLLTINNNDPNGHGGSNYNNQYYNTQYQYSKELIRLIQLLDNEYQYYYGR